MPKLMIFHRDLGWWFWAASAILLAADLAGQPQALPLAVGLSGVQILWFWRREGQLHAFPVQVRLAYTAILAAALWPPAHGIIWAPAIGTPLQVVFGYCALARALSLLAWNRAEPLSWRLVRRVFLSPPVGGSVLQGLPAVASPPSTG